MSKKKNLVSKANAIIFTIIMALTLFILFSVMYAKVNGNQPRILGYSFHIVLTDSMTPEINAGDFIGAVKADKESIKEGDNIIFVSPDPSLKGMTIVHKVLKVNNDNGILSFTTTGIKEGAQPDDYPVYEIVGKYAFKSAFIGKIFTILSKAENIFFFIFIIIIVVIITKQIKNILKIKKEYESNNKGK